MPLVSVGSVVMPSFSFLVLVICVFSIFLPIGLGQCSFHQLSQWVDSVLTYELDTELIKISDLFSRHPTFPREKLRALSSLGSTLVDRVRTWQFLGVLKELN